MFNVYLYLHGSGFDYAVRYCTVLYMLYNDPYDYNYDYSMMIIIIIIILKLNRLHRLRLYGLYTYLLTY